MRLRVRRVERGAEKRGERRGERIVEVTTENPALRKGGLSDCVIKRQHREVGISQKRPDLVTEREVVARCHSYDFCHEQGWNDYQGLPLMVLPEQVPGRHAPSLVLEPLHSD